jgi:hypothetical protein
MGILSILKKTVVPPSLPQIKDYPKDRYQVYWETFISGDMKTGFTYKVRLIEHQTSAVLDTFYGEMQKQEDALAACHKWIIQIMKQYKRVV